MKKILSLTMAALMMVSMIPTAYAAEGDVVNHDVGTKITLNGSGTEEWTVTVPAKMVPGDTGAVKASGMWASDKFLNVGIPSEVELTYGAQTMNVALTLAEGETALSGGFSLIGNCETEVSREISISVADASRLFGTWEGTVVYDVALIQKGDFNRDGVITEADATELQSAYNSNAELTDEQKLYADIDGDGEIQLSDARKIYQVTAGNYAKGAINGTVATE